MYALQSTDISGYITGAVMPKLTQGNLNQIEIAHPSIDEQRAIARILGALDDKIELNRRMNQTLEDMARALFKSWFVDFDGVAQEDMQESELGLIPKGWRVGSVYEVADVIYGAPFASKLFDADKSGKPLIRIRDLADENPGVWTSEVHPKGYLVKAGDIVVGMDGEFRAHLWGGSDAWLNQRICVLKPKANVSAAFVRNSIIAPLAYIESSETATAVIHLGKGDIDNFEIVIPPSEVLTKFGQACQPFYDRTVTNKRESRTLAQLCDTLLPKLISGELRVRDAEHIAEKTI
jgi:type I restriction enzyme S subunit